MEKVTWVIDKTPLARMIYHSRDLPAVVRSLGHDVIVVDRPPDGRYIAPPRVQGASVLYGTHEFVKALTVDPVFQPGPLGVNARTQVSSYMSNLPEDWFLNRFSSFMTWGMFKWRMENFPGSLPWNKFTDKMFVRPNSGFKTFAGTVLDRNKDLKLDMKCLDELSGVMPETLILATGAIQIDGEFRFVIADGQVVTGSEYRWDGKLDVRRDWPQSCWDMAEKVARHEWQVDIAYTCDVAVIDGEARVVELNGFSCAGLYACDLEKVVGAVSRAAHREWAGLDI